MEESKINIKFTEWKVAACNSCHAHTHLHKSLDSVGERVKHLYELQIGGIVVTLCDKCLDILVEKIQNRPRNREE